MLANSRLAVTSQKKKFNFRVWFHGHVLYVKQAYNGTVTRYMSEECSVTSRKWKKHLSIWFAWTYFGGKTTS